ncbi:MAG: hypothetical protein ACI9ON_003679 [Limisphaerales bacterium]|jgi:hypothetical protein
MRTGDKSERAYFGAKRFFNVESEWYFATREMCDQGPYQTQELAEVELAAYLGWCRKFAPKSLLQAETQRSNLPDTSYKPVPIAATKSGP